MPSNCTCISSLTETLHACLLTLAFTLPIYTILPCFFSALIIASDCPEQIGALALFQRFMLFVNAGMYRVHHTETSFGRHVRRIAGVTKTRQARGTIYQLDAERIKRHLAENNELDEDASLV